MKLSQVKQRALDLLHTVILRADPCDDYHVQTTIEHVFMQSVAFPDQPGQMMSDNTVSNFFTHGNP